MTSNLESQRPTSRSLSRTSASQTLNAAAQSQQRGDTSPPRTPTNRPDTSGHGKGNSAAANRALNVKTTTRETFLDDVTPTENGASADSGTASSDARDSHDLSVPEREVTRDSLVDHMLLSLDQYSYGQMPGGFPGQPTDDEAQLYAAFEDEEPYSTYNTSMRADRSGHAYSYSSDYEDAHTHTRSRSSSQLTGRGRRSDSSSNNFQSGLDRANNGRNQQGGPANASFQRSAQPQARQLHSRSGKGSKGSSTASFDAGYARVGSTQRWGASQNHGRSSSFDFGHERPSIAQDFHSSPRQAVAPFAPYDYDAAPTPTVPGGPRRQRPISPASPIKAPVVPQQPERKRSGKSSKSVYKPRGLEASNALGINFGLNDADRDLPPLPAFIAPAPLVGYSKTKDEAQRSSSVVPQSKDKPGFFRRVFGSSKNNPVAATDAASTHGSTASGDNAADRRAHQANQAKPTSRDRELPLPPPQTPQKDQPPVLTKKPSSFFRRRKKSISEAAAPPMPIIPPQIQPGRDNLLTDPEPASPVSSLRQIMNPYLAGATKPDTPQTIKDSSNYQLGSRDLDEDIRSFSPGYTPDKNATIRAVKPDSRDGSKPASRDLHSSSDIEVSPTADRNRTFMLDSSDTDRAGSPSRTPSTAKDERSKMVVSPIPTPADVARDRALVAEYERIYSKKSPSISKPPRSFTDDSLKSAFETASGGTKYSRAPAQSDEWVVITPTKQEAGKDGRLYIKPTTSEEDLLESTNLDLPTAKSQRSSASTATVYKSATSLPIVQVDGETPAGPNPPEVSSKPSMPSGPVFELLDEPEEIADDGEPSEIDRERARKIFDGNEDFVLKSKAAAWLGDQDSERQKTLLAYMQLYDFADLNILAALRILCGRLVLRAESQQVDRILDGFAHQWCKCNPNHGFKVYDVVHTICYSLLLLNTDLHLADIDSKMTRSQFVKNTMPTILRVIQDSAPGAFDRPSILPGRSHTYDGEDPPAKDELAPKDTRSSIDVDRPSWRGSMKPPKRMDSEGNEGQKPTPLNYSTPRDDCGPLVKAPFHGTLRTWEVQVEIVLKDFYNSIKDERLPLSIPAAEKPVPAAQSQNSLSVFGNGLLRRTPSVLSKAPSEAQSFSRARSGENVRLGTAKWAAKNRSRARIYPNSTMASSRTSLDDQSSMWSPSMSTSTWSKYSLGKTHTSMSTDSLGSAFAHGDYQRSIGFASALSDAIVREEVGGSGGSILSGDSGEFGRVMPLLEDESLGLYGAPWAKEGIVKHKHHLEAADKKAKDRNWNEVFAVVEKGYLTLFSFSSKSMKNKSKGKTANAVVGGGNWQDSAENLGHFLLRQTIASALPPPGYSKARPHVWALTLPTGAVHLFQVGSPEIVKEYVSTANYWSARLSNHPLIGGISNIEYGWSSEIINNSLVTAINEQNPTPNGHSRRPSTSHARSSLQSSLRSSLDQGTGGAFRSKLPGDKVTISEWSPPSQSMRASNLLEMDQLRTLIAYVEGIEDELRKHNLLRSAMLLAYTPRSTNGNRAMANWEKKSSYLLKEIVKYRTYIDILHGAEAQKKVVYEEREERKAELERAMQEEEDEDETLRPE